MMVAPYSTRRVSIVFYAIWGGEVVNRVNRLGVNIGVNRHMVFCRDGPMCPSWADTLIGPYQTLVNYMPTCISALEGAPSE